MERLLTFKAPREGERKQVTVLFADMTGSMELLADRDPEEARQLLDPVLEPMMDAVHRRVGHASPACYCRPYIFLPATGILAVRMSPDSASVM